MPSGLREMILPTVARYLLAGRPRPPIEDAVRIGEVMRRAALAQFGWREEPETGRRMPLAPSVISGRSAAGRPLQEAGHAHAFWLPEDADDDGRIDHLSVYVAAGMDASVRAALDRLTRLWLADGGATGDEGDDQAGRHEWRLALEGFGTCDEFADVSAVFGRAPVWTSVTPFLPTAHLKGTGDRGEAWERLKEGEPVSGALAEATGYPREVRRLVDRRGILEAASAERAQVDLLPSIDVHGVPRSPMHFHRFRSSGRERTTAPRGALLRIRFPHAVAGPLALGYGCHFGLGMFAAAGGDPD